MAEVLYEFATPIAGEDGRTYMARACGDEMRGGLWQGWIEFIPMGRGEPVRSARETTQPNRQDARYWASGLTPIFLEGSLRRALNPFVRPAPRNVLPALFDSPAPNARVASPPVETVLNPFSLFRKGESLLRRRLAALSGWHLVNIIAAHGLSDRDPSLIAAMEPAALVEVIINGVKDRVARAVR